MSQKRKPTPDSCPVCGARLSPRALACPECGSDHESGWSEDAHTDGLDLPDADFDYDEFVKEEFGGKPRARLHPLWWLTALILLILFVWAILLR